MVLRRPAWVTTILTAVMVAASLHTVVVGAEPARAEQPETGLTEDQALAQARKSGRPVELTARRTETLTVSALPSGRLEAVQHLQPIRTRKNGRWQDIDTDLRRSGSDIVPGATTVGLHLSPGGEGPLARMSFAGRELALSWPQRLPEPVLDGDTATYAGVLGPDVDLKVTATRSGFSHLLVVKTAEAAKDPRLAKLVLGMRTTRLSVRKDGANGLKAVDTGSKAPVFDAPEPQMWDSSKPAESPQPKSMPQRPVDGPAEGARTARLAVGLETGRLTLVPDRQMLASPDTKFPVYIDPVWDTSTAKAWAMVSSGYPSQTYYKFNGKSTEGVGYCDVSRDTTCVKNQIKRLFYRMPLPSLKGSFVQSTEFVAYETGAFDCDNATSVQLWRATALSSSATWDNTKYTSENGGAWVSQLASRDVAYCSRAPVEFGGSTLKSNIQSALNNGYGTITFGLKAYSETSMSWWKRFADDAYLKIQYNRPPAQPDTDTMSSKPGTQCVDKPQAKPTNVRPKLYAKLTDPDSEDAHKVQGQFEVAWTNADGSSAKWTAPLTAALTTGSTFTVDLEKLNAPLPIGKVLDWYVRAWDGEVWGPWSWAGAQTGCYFIYDPSIPAAPDVNSLDYPDNQTWNGGVGQTGTFSVDDPANLASRYRFSLNGGPETEATTSAGAARSISLAPDRSGPNFLTVTSYTAGSQNSAPTTYEFWANTGRDPKARFTLDQPPGTTSVTAVTRDGDPAVAATVNGTLSFGTAGQVGSALTSAGGSPAGDLTTSGPLLDTTKSFSVSAWVKLASRNLNQYVVSQEGTSEAAFQMGFETTMNRWIFRTRTADAQDASWVNAVSTLPPNLDEWTHLAGVYDQNTKQIRLFVNGELQATVAAQPWNATGALVVGRSKYHGHNASYWNGTIDDLRIYDRVIGGQEANELVTQQPVLKGRWKLNTDGSGEPSGAVPLSLEGGASIDPLSGFAFVSSAGLLLNGTTAYAQTAAPPINTDESFTVAGWVYNARRPQRAATVFSLAGANTNAFALRYVPDPADPANVGGWEFDMSNADDGSPTLLRQARNSTFTETGWDHIALVYDALRDRMSLYVDGTLEESADGVSEAGSVIGFKAANGGLQVGRNKLAGTSGGEYWPDAIDDLWVYQGALSPLQIGQLAVPMELDTGDGP
jgi:hypothetical protein